MQNMLIKSNGMNKKFNRTASILSDLVLAICSESSEEVTTELVKKAMAIISNGQNIEPKEASGYLQKSLMSLGIETQAPLAESVGTRCSGLAITFCRELIREYDCKTASEKATAQIVANAYVRVMEFSRKMEYGRSADGTTNEINGYYAVMSKELDRASRHYTSALSMLRQLKALSFQINVTAKNAFIADNQQFNAKPPGS